MEGALRGSELSPGVECMESVKVLEDHLVGGGGGSFRESCWR